MRKNINNVNVHNNLLYILNQLIILMMNPLILLLNILGGINMNNIKRLALSIFSACIAGSIIFNIPVVAYDETHIQTSKDEIMINLEDAIEDEAEVWLKGLYNDSVQICDIIPIISPDTYCFCVSFTEDDVPCGYAVFDYYDGEFVVSEYTDTLGANDIYSNIKNDIISEHDYNRCEIIGDFMFKTAPFEYALGYIDDVGTVHNEDCYGNDVETPYYVPQMVYSYNSSSSIFISSGTFNSKSKYKIDSTYTIDVSGAKFTSGSRKGQYKAFASSSYNKIAGKYNCGITSGLHILAIKGIIGDSITNNGLAYIYNQLFFHVTSQSLDGVENGVSIYGIYPSVAKDAILSYFKYNTKYKNTYVDYMSNPSVSWIKKQLKANKPIMFCYYINVKDKGVLGHAVTVFGYRKASKVISNDLGLYTDKYNFLAVCDGWNSVEKYINYSKVEFASNTQAYSFTCKL